MSRLQRRKMTGPQHYVAAQNALDAAVDTTCPEQAGRLFAEAQVHATLAMAAATAMNGYDASGSDGQDFAAWDRVCGEGE
jgi:hypothetical protein